MKLVLLASLLVVATAEPQNVTPKLELLAQPFPNQPFLPGQYSRGAYDQYNRGGYRQYDPYYRGQYDSKYTAGQYDSKYYAGQYDPKYYGGQYDAKYYAGQNDPKYYGGQYDAKYYAGQSDKYYGGQYDPKYYAGQYDPKIYPGAYDPKHYGGQYRNQYQHDPKYYQQYQNHIPIVEQSSETNPDGSFRYSYTTADGQQAHAEGIVKKSDLDPQDEVNSVRGAYSYTAPDGTPVSANYIADEYGFRVEGSHIPKNVGGLQNGPGLEYNNPNFDKYQNNYPGYYNKLPYNPYARPVGPIPVAPVPQK